VSTRSTPVLSSSSEGDNSNYAVLDIEDTDWFSDFDYSEYDDEPRFVLPVRIPTEATLDEEVS
jgi:hypothetical protein